MTEAMPTIALVGNPNAGKTTLFNQLTGSHQHVGNWPGVTVEQKSGAFDCDGQRLTVVDLPGTYSLQDMGDDDSLDQQIARQFVHSGEAQVALNIVDATSLQRGLFLTLQLIESGVPVVVALNMMDAAEKLRINIDIQALSSSLGCPVVEIVASRGRGLAELRSAVAQQLNAQRQPDQLAELADETSINARYERVGQILQATLQQDALPRRSATDLIDSVLLNRFLAFPLFLGVMYLMFMFTINIGGAFTPAFDGVAAVLFVEGPRSVMEALSFPAWLSTFIADGVGGGVQLVMNTTEGAQAVEDSKSIRSIALYDKIPYYTTAAGSHAAALAIKAQAEGDLVVKSLQG